MLSPESVTKLREVAENAQWHKNALNCSKCPKSLCPAWTDVKFFRQNPETGVQEELNLRGCSFTLLPVFLSDNTYQTAKTRAAIVEVGNQTANLIGRRILQAVKILGGQRFLPGKGVNEINGKDVKQLDEAQ